MSDFKRKKQVLTIGIMTGNSLDGADLVLTAFESGGMEDIAGVSVPYPLSLKEDMLELRKKIISYHSDMDKAVKGEVFKRSVAGYTEILAQGVEELIEKSGVKREEIAAIGLSGQSTGEHNPPSVAGKSEPFTTQIFNAPELAQRTGIKVIYDFRSDDIFAGGEGAPLAPMHNLHLSYGLSKKGLFPVCFINGGNTANLAVISSGTSLRKEVLGFDCGPFNHYADALCRAFYNKEYDEGGEFGRTGQINAALLSEMYKESAVTIDGENFYDLVPPKSSGPHLYTMTERLKDYPLPEEDILRTVEYMAAYSVFLSLRFIPDYIDFPKYFLFFGGGWNNMTVYRDFMSLLHGRGMVLPEHQAYAEGIRQRMRGERFFAASADAFGINGKYTEARIMADLAYCFLERKEFTRPEVTGCFEGKVLGIACEPGKNLRRRGRGFLYSRAAKGWQKVYGVKW